MKQQNTIRRLIGQFHGQRVRLTVIGVSIIFYVALSIWTPTYSAIVIDRLWQSVKSG